MHVEGATGQEESWIQSISIRDSDGVRRVFKKENFRFFLAWMPLGPPSYVSIRIQSVFLHRSGEECLVGLREVTVLYWVVGVVWYVDSSFNRAKI